MKQIQFFVLVLVGALAPYTMAQEGFMPPGPPGGAGFEGGPPPFIIDDELLKKAFESKDPSIREMIHAQINKDGPQGFQDKDFRTNLLAKLTDVSKPVVEQVTEVKAENPDCASTSKSVLDVSESMKRSGLDMERIKKVEDEIQSISKKMTDIEKSLKDMSTRPLGPPEMFGKSDGRLGGKGKAPVLPESEDDDEGPHHPAPGGKADWPKPPSKGGKGGMPKFFGASHAVPTGPSGEGAPRGQGHFGAAAGGQGMGQGFSAQASSRFSLCGQFVSLPQDAVDFGCPTGQGQGQGTGPQMGGGSMMNMGGQFGQGGMGLNGGQGMSMMMGQDPYGQQQGGIPFGQQQMGMSFGQQQMGMPFGQQQMGMTYGQQQMGMPFGQQQMGMTFGQQQMGMPFGQQQMGMPFGQQPMGMSYGQQGGYFGGNMMGIGSMGGMGRY